MIRQFLALVTLALFWCAAAEQRKPEEVLKVLQAQFRRDGQKLLIDARIVNQSQAAIQGAELYFNFLDSAGKGISSRHTELEPDGLDAGDEAEIRLATPYPEEAVKVRLDVKDRRGKPLGLANAGPYAID